MTPHVGFGVAASMFALIGFLSWRGIETEREEFVTGALVIAIFGALIFGLGGYYEWVDHQCQTNPQYRFDNPDDCS